MATTSASLPEQQQPGETLMSNPEAASSSSSSSSAWHSSGSLGPFFAVMSVLTVLAIISCALGKRCTKRAASPTEISMGDTDWFGWVKRKCRRCISGDVEIGPKIKGFGRGKNDVQVKDVENQPPPQA